MPIVKEKVLINNEYLKEYSPIPKNYNLDEVIPYIKVSELIWIVPVIGQTLYEELLEEVDKNEITDVNSTLLLKIYSAEAVAVTYEALPFISLHISEVGITKGKSENSDSASSADVNYLSQHLKAQLQAKIDDLKYFLKHNAEFYPLYEVSHDCCAKKYDPFKELYKPKGHNKEIK